MAFKITVLKGDGIGPEITDSAIRLLSIVGAQEEIEFKVVYKPIGGCSIDQFGTPLTDETLEECLSSNAIFLGAVGGPKWDALQHKIKPEQALLKLRKELKLYSNLRPAKVYNSLLAASSLKSAILKDVDIMVIRELTGGIYFGEPRGLTNEKGWNTLEYSIEEVKRIARVAFRIAEKRKKHLVSVHKSNVLESSQFWKDVVHNINNEFPSVDLVDMYVDNAAMQLVREPSQFDVILTQNLFGDILSDISGMITGSLGMLPSASIGDKYAMYEPVHGSAPDIAGKNLANPIASIASIAMMFEHSFNLPAIANKIYFAIERVLDGGRRTKDIAPKETKFVSTIEITDLIIEEYKRQPKNILITNA